MALISQPTAQTVDILGQDSTGAPKLTGITTSWRTFLQAVFNLLTGMTQSGPTASRPSPLWIGQPYLDTTLGSGLGKPVFVGGDGKTWIDATGASV